MKFDIYHTKGSLSAGAGHQANQEEFPPTRIDASDKKHAERAFYEMPLVKIFGKRIIQIKEAR